MAEDTASDVLSALSGVSIFSNISAIFNNGNLNPMIKDILTEYKSALKTKPTYRLKGESQNLYKESSEKLRNIYHKLSEHSDEFIEQN